MTNLCQNNHQTHETLEVETLLGRMNVYDWSKYTGFAGYCSGQDDVCQTLINTGGWEPELTGLVKNILGDGDRSLRVVDVGANVGWYSLLAGHEGYKVEAFEGNEETAEVLNSNVRLHELEELVNVHFEWIGGATEPLQETYAVEFFKCDLEGSEWLAVNKFRRFFEQRLVHYALLEISPCFNDTYPALVNQIEGWGYWAQNPDLTPFDGDFGFSQTNLLFVRADR